MSYVQESEKPVFRGKLNLPMLTCQKCGYVVARGVNMDYVKDLISYCPKCGSFLFYE